MRNVAECYDFTKKTRLQISSFSTKRVQREQGGGLASFVAKVWCNSIAFGGSSFKILHFAFVRLQDLIICK